MRTRIKLQFGVVLLIFTWNAQSFAFYNPQTGRWLTRDPIQERQEVSLYGFVKNGPINRIDFLGLCQCQISLPLMVRLTPPNNPAINGRLPISGGPPDKAIWDASWDEDGDGKPDGDYRIWFTMIAVFNECCEFRQEVKGKFVKDGKVLWDQSSFRDDRYNRAVDPGAYHTLSPGVILFSDWDNPGISGPISTGNIWMQLRGYIIDVCPKSPTFGKKIGPTKDYGFLGSGIPPINVHTWGFDQWPW